ncbi:MAG: hypothetical protein HS130_01075 [Deltaproteobacteria bacterium]|nr:hypothetical protein [Deltaproteobacteria bacterium]MCL4873821.1 hypothetical protein [bacterium]
MAKRAIDIVISTECRAVIDKLKANPRLMLKLVKEQKRLRPLFNTYADDSFKAADGANERRVVFEPSQSLREFMAAFAP